MARVSASEASPASRHRLLSLAAPVSYRGSKKACLKAFACRSNWWNLNTRVEPKPKLSFKQWAQNQSPAGTDVSFGVRQ
eukprot:6190452-Pleurochrysis_carterae.AAC.5